MKGKNMNMKKILAVTGICLTSFVFSDMPVSAQNEPVPYVVTVYNEQNGLPTGEANTILQTSDGYIWIGSYGGLIRYDGSSFRNYSVEGKITSSSIRSLYEDSAGRLWIGTNDAGVVMMENDVFTAVESPADNSFLCIRDFTEDENGKIYVASNSGIAEISDGKIVPCAADKLTGYTIYSVAIDSYGRLWGSTNNGDCVVLDDGEFKELFTPERVFDDGSDIYSIDSDENGNIVIGSNEAHAAVVQFPTESLAKDDITVKIHDTGDVNAHNTVTAYAENHIFVSGINGFVVIYPDGHIKEFGEKDKAMSVNSAIVDYENNIWLASSSYGVIRYSLGCFSVPDSDGILNGVDVNAVAFSEGNYYIGHDTGLIICDSNWNMVENELTEMFKDVRIRCIITDDSGNVWLASYSDNAAVCYNPADGDIQCFSAENGLAGDKARVAAKLSDGKIAIGMQTGVSIIENGEVVRSYTVEDGLENPSVLCIYDGGNGEILVGSDGAGIYRINGDEIETLGFNKGLDEGVVLRMCRNSDGGGWFVSAGSSLYYWENDSFTRLSNFTKGAGSIFELYDKDGRLWLLQNNGLIALDKAQLLSGNETDAIHYGSGHGLAGTINANTWHWLSEDGQLYISNRNGISIFGFEGVNNALPRIVVGSVNVDGQTEENPKRIEVESKNQRITINYSALSFTDTAELRIGYKLEGFDREETFVTDKSGSVSYTNLPGGSYTFTVRVFSPENPEAQVMYSVPVIKSKRLVELPIFWFMTAALLIFLGCGAVMLATRMKINGMNRRQQEYRSIIEQSLMTFAKTIDAKDPYTNGHSIRVAMYSRELAKRLDMSAEEQENIYYMALLHDIGKIGVPDNILNKPGKLTPEEMQIIQRHVDIGGEILKDFTALEGIANGAQYHHERFDGKGYSKGLKGLDIPKVARIIAVADTYDAMSSDRCYRKALPTEVIVSEFEKHNGAQFDPEIVPHILDMIDKGVVPMDIE